MTVEAARRIRLPWGSAVSREDLVRQVERDPTMAWHVPGTNDHLIAYPWRRRSDIAEVVETRGESRRPLLWEAFLGARSGGKVAVLIEPAEYHRAYGFYRSAGVTLLEEVIVLRSRSLPGPPVPITLDVRRATVSDVDDLLTVDHAAFPWLWRNSREEFEEYVSSPDVRVWLGCEGPVPVAYAGATDMGGWGHVDRLAVRAGWQGRGYGAQLLACAMRWLGERGIRHAQLSTQRDNARSQGLYRRFGFEQTRGTMRLHGLVLRGAEASTSS